MALKVVQDGMRQKIPTTVITSIGEAAEVSGNLFNTHKCLLKSGVKNQKRLKSQPATNKWGSSNNHIRRLWEIPQKARRRMKKGGPLPPQEKTPKRGEGSPSPSYAQVNKSHARNEEGD